MTFQTRDEALLDDVLDAAFEGADKLAPDDRIRTLWNMGLAIAEHALRLVDNHTQEGFLRQVEQEMRTDLAILDQRAAIGTKAHNVVDIRTPHPGTTGGRPYPFRVI